MIIGELSRRELTRRCRQGLAWRIGPFAISVQVQAPLIIENLAFLYADYPICDNAGIIDAFVTVRSAGLMGRHVDIRIDGRKMYCHVPMEQAVPVLEWTLNLCVFHQPSVFLLLHAAAVERDGRVAIFPGEAGAGKSTLCAALIHSGWRLMSDEVAVVRPGDQWIFPSPRPVSLKEESIPLIKGFAPTSRLGRVWPGTAKGQLAHVVPPRESIERMGQGAAPAWIICPNYQPDAKTSLQPCPKDLAFMQCAGNAFNYDVLGAVGFRTLSALVDACDCYAFTYCNLVDAVSRFQELSDSYVGEHSARGCLG